ncbi:ead/Ea22-like family protein [Escherichia coli]|nr:ead/Ea22-like family protein [Escherichia coli]MCQ3488369.1 ead/Ea22-like family protein [Salmonella enterica subsp. enterica serovar Indiana]MDJ6062845.1 ead/Ea22-like family protein [Salmonella enterica]MCL7100531.1 ead/Ea22-like family protein [Escherichia coli]MCL7105451.1 ead/Ea22-like family protein [Escherichia coli]MCL7116305.1 ead/Ea22-like family protein [Escherichia coli]
MKQMSLIEMDDFLKGKCIPRDLKVNETNAEYLVRKFAEAEAKCAALAEDQQKAIESIKQADAAVKLAHEKFSALAAENAGLKHAMAVTLEHVSVTDAGQAGVAAMIINDALHHSETPTTDAFLAEVRAQAFNDLCSAFVKHANLAGMDDGELVRLKYATDALLHCADKIRKGVQS